MNNKVESFISILLLVGNESSNPQYDSKKFQFSCSKEFQATTNNKFMGYVDLVDFDKMIRRFFSANVHFKKWYKKEFHGIIDILLKIERYLKFVHWHCGYYKRKGEQLRLESLYCWIDVELGWSSRKRHQIQLWRALIWWYYIQMDMKWFLMHVIVKDDENPRGATHLLLY